MPKILTTEEQEQAKLLLTKIRIEQEKLVHLGATKLSPEYIALKDQYKALTEQDYASPRHAHSAKGAFFRPRTESRNSISPVPDSAPAPTTKNSS